MGGDIARILAEVVLQSKEAIAGWKQFGAAGVAEFKRIAAAAQAASSQASASMNRISAGLAGVGKKAKEIGAGIKAVGGAISILGAGLGLFGRTAINSFTDSEKASQRLNAAFDAMGGKLKIPKQDMIDFANTAQKSFPVSDEAVLDLQSTLINFGNIAPKQFKAARQAAIDYATVSGQDLPAAADLLTKALADPVRGIRSLKEAQIALTAEQRASITGFVAMGNVTAAQDLILAEFTKRYHEAASVVAQSDTSQAVIAFNRLDDALETVGGQLIKIKIIALNFAASIVEAFNNLPPGVQQAIIAIGAFIIVLGPILFVIGTIVTGFGSLATAASFLAPAFAGIGPTIAAFGEILFTVVAIIGEVAVAIATAVGWPIIIAAALGALVVIVFTKWDTVKQIVGDAMAWIGEKIRSAWAGLGDVVDIAIGLWQSAWNVFFAFLNSKWAGLGDFVRATLEAMVSPITNAINLAKELWAWLTKAAAAAPAANAAGGPGTHRAQGGQVFGRAGIDKVRAWLTNKEFVHRVAAVKKYGVGFMRAVNSGRFPLELARGFANGGLVGRPRMAFASGGQASASARQGFTLVIGDKSFSGLSAPVDVAGEMIRFSRESQQRRNGISPPWFR